MGPPTNIIGGGRVTKTTLLLLFLASINNFVGVLISTKGFTTIIVSFAFARAVRSLTDSALRSV